jgi:hypothetical protein
LTRLLRFFDGLEGGGFGGGGGINLNLAFNGPADGPSVARWFKAHRQDIANTLRGAVRNNTLTPRTL